MCIPEAGSLVREYMLISSFVVREHMVRTLAFASSNTDSVLIVGQLLQLDSTSPLLLRDVPK